MDNAQIERRVRLIAAETMFRTTGKLFVPAAVSARHVHLCRADVERLFGAGHTLHKFKELSQPGQFACQEQVTVVGPRGQLAKVRVLGPERKQTQVEVSLTDAFTLGLKVPVRMSGDVDGTPACKLIGSAGEVEIPQGVIAAARHLHLSEEQSALFGLSDGQVVSLRTEGARAAILENVIVRAGKGHDMEVHIDTDEANALGIAGSTMMEVIK